MSKLTLSADDNTIRMAKKYAKLHNTSVSAIFSRFIQGLMEQEHKDISSDAKLSTLSKISGVVQLPDGKTYDDLRREAVKKRFGV